MKVCACTCVCVCMFAYSSGMHINVKCIMKQTIEMLIFKMLIIINGLEHIALKAKECYVLDWMILQDMLSS